MTRDEAQGIIEREIATARHARACGNEGKVRVCSRRAAGTAISFWLQSHPEKRRGVDAMSQLRSLHADDSVAKDLREAAKRLTTRITREFEPPFPEDPIEDAQHIIHHLLEYK